MSFIDNRCTYKKEKYPSTRHFHSTKTKNTQLLFVVSCERIYSDEKSTDSNIMGK